MRTEQISPRYVELDSWSAAEMIAAMYEGQLAAAAAVRGALGAIAAAVEDAVPALQRGGRIVYAGAGTSGRIGVQDGSELPPTYDWPADRLVFAMAGGLDALVRSAEQAEDNEAAGAQAMADAKIGANDVVIGVAASGTTPFTIGALRASSAAGAVTIAVANNPGAPLFEVARHRILADTGSEVIAGSTRMKAGTAQKIVLNLFSTAVMVKMGRVYRGLMVDMRARNAKLRRRAEAMVSEIVRCPEGDAARYLEQADGHVKTAVLLGLGLGRSEATQLLQRHGGNLRSAINASNARRMAEPHTGSAMARETAEIPAAAERLLARTDMFAAIVERIEQAKPRIVVFCGRGSSGHVGVYLRYLFEARLGLLASAAAPSVVTAYQRPPDMRDALFVVVSQSGRSPDLVDATQVARKFGALTLAIVNDENSPAAAASELVLPIGAGTEHAVAATKTVVLSMIAGAQLVAALARDDDLNDGLATSAAPIVRRARVRLVGLGRQCGGRARRPLSWDVDTASVASARSRSRWPKSCGSRLSVTARPSCGTVRAHRSRRQRPCWCCDRTTRPPPPSTTSSVTWTMRVRRCLPPEARRGRCPGSATVTRFAIQSSCSSRPIAPSRRSARRRGFDPDNPPYLSKVTRTL